MKPTFPDILPGVDGEEPAQSPVVTSGPHELLLADLSVVGKVHQTEQVLNLLGHYNLLPLLFQRICRQLADGHQSPHHFRL